MAIFWSEELVIGHEIIDRDHEQIIKLINELEQVIERYHDEQTIYQIYGKIVDSLSDHFIREENIMTINKYIDANEHTKIHGSLFAKLTNFMYLLENRSPGVEAMIIDFLHRWFFRHVLEKDKEMVVAISTHQKNQYPG